MIKNKNKYYKVLLLILLFMLLPTFTVLGGTKVDLSSNRVIGINGEFYFQIPLSWENYVVAERESNDGQEFLDKINFYYVPRDEGNSKFFLMALTAYDSDKFVSVNEEKKLLANNNLIFTTVATKYNPYTTVNDSIIFGRFLVEIGNVEFLQNKIVTPKSITADKYNTIIVNKTFLEKYVVSEKDGELYLPLAEIARKLGYKVTWYPGPRIVNLAKGDNNVVVNANNTKNQKILFIDSRIYMPISFFMQHFNVNVEVDARNNVKLKG